MAIFFLNATIISRSSGLGSAVGSAAYRHNAKMKSITDGKTFKWVGKDDVVHSEINIPTNAPEWAREAYGDVALKAELGYFDGSLDAQKAVIAKLSQRLWNDVEVHEETHNRRRDSAQLSRAFTVALPNNLTVEDQIDLGRTYVQTAFTDRGMIADWVIHNAKDKEVENAHMHIMVTMRDIGEAGWGLKNRDWSSRSYIQTWRREWADLANIAMARAGLDERIDHRSYIEQGIDLEATSYNPHVAATAEANSETAFEKERALEARVKNAEYLRANPEHILVVLSAQQAAFTLADIRVALQERLDVPGEELEGYVATVMASKELVKLTGMSPDNQVQYSTMARATLENNMVVAAAEMAQQKLAVDPQSGLELLSESLAPTQRDAAEAMLNDKGLTLVTGYAGTGKTYTLHEVAKVWNSRGYEVIGGAASGKATQELSGIVGFEAASLAAWESRWSRGRRPNDKFVFVMDEAGMVGADVWARVQGQVSNMGGKLIAIGDPEQVQPVNQTNAFKANEERIGATVMENIIRQNNALDREATRMFALGGVSSVTALRYYDGKGCVKFVDNQAVAIDAIVQDYFSHDVAPEHRGAQAYTNNDVWELNAKLRDEALSLGVVDEHTERNFGTITRIERNQDGTKKRIHLPLNVGRGDRLIFTKSHREHDIPKSSLCTVLDVRNGSISILVDGKKTPVEIDMTTFNDFDYGFAVTIHKSQGMTVKYNNVLGHPQMDQHLGYVSMTRQEDGVMFYAPKNRIKDMGALEDIFQKSSYLTFDIGDNPTHMHERSGAYIDGTQTALRADYMPSNLQYKAVSFTGDAHLTGVLSRLAGLLESEYVDGDPVFEKDVRGYGDTPTLVVDDLIAVNSTFTAADVANQLASVVKEPDTFIRLFREAMAHDDILVLHEEADAGNARIYSTRKQVALELDVVDRAARLTLLSTEPAKPLSGGVHNRLVKDFALTDSQSRAIGATGKAQLSVISGASGSGKSRVAAALSDGYLADKWSVVCVAPTGVGADVLRAQGGKAPVMTLAALEYAIENERVELNSNTVIVLDEAGQVGADTAERLFSHIEKSGARLVALRDTDQLGSYSAGPIFEAIEHRIGGSRLEGSHRIENRNIAACLAQIKDGSFPADKISERLNGQGVIHGGGTLTDSINRVALDYVNDNSTNKIALAHSRTNVAKLNEKIRQHLDAKSPERLNDLPKVTPEGSNADLRLGDKVSITAPYRTGDTYFKAGTQFEVQSRSPKAVTLRARLGEAEQTIEIKNDDQDFEYKFGFSTTVHGSKGQSIENVHFLGTSGMSRDVLYTGAALHEKELSIVMATSEAKKEHALRAILQTDGTSRSALDYGFDAARHAREAIKSNTTLLNREPSKLVQGFDRLIDFVADGIDPREAVPRDIDRATQLRAVVVAEMIESRIQSGSKEFSAAERHKLEENIGQLINQRAWDRFFGRERAGDQAQSDVMKQAIPQERMIQRILQRGALAAHKSQSTDMYDWFKDTLAHHEARVQKDVRANAMNEVQSVQMEKALNDIRSVDRRKDLARSFASTLSRHVAVSDEIHQKPDLVGDVEALLKNAMSPDVVKHPRLMTIANDVAHKRHAAEIRTSLEAELNTSGRATSRSLYKTRNPFQNVNLTLAKQYDEEVIKRTASITPESYTVGTSDIVAAMVHIGAEIDGGNLTADKMLEVSQYEVSSPEAGKTAFEDRPEVLKSLDMNVEVTREEREAGADKLLARLYKSFTRPEIEGLMAESRPANDISKADVVNVSKSINQISNARPGIVAPHHSRHSLQELDRGRDLDGPTMSM